MKVVHALLAVLLAAPLACFAPEVPAQEPAPEAATGVPAPEVPAAEVPAAEPAQPNGADFAKPMGPPDPLNRGTPRGAMQGFLSSARKSDYARAAGYLDLRGLAPEVREDGPELARRLKVVLDQTLWVDLVNLSDQSAGHAEDDLPAWQDRLGDVQTAAGTVTLLLQRVPREDDGTRIWQVSAATVSRIPDLYAEFQPVWLEDLLPAVLFEVDLLGLALWKWASLVVLVFAASLVALAIAGSATRLLGVLFTRQHRAFDKRIVKLVQGPVRLALTIVLFAIGSRFLGLPLEFLRVLRYVERLLLVVALAWLVFRLIDLAVLTLRSRAESLGNAGVLPVLSPAARIAKFSILLIGLLGVLGTLGVNVSAAVAGLGVGGIAVALAAQKTVENLFGGVSLFADRPIQVGDFFRYGTEVGTVEEIGLRSTRIRTLDRTVVTIPNAEFSNLRLENYALRDRMRLYTMLGVRYETTPDQLRYLLTRLREILLAHPRILEDPARVRFVGFGAYSLDIEVFAYADTNDWSEFLGIREDVYFRFMDAVAESGSGFAFPSSTTYLGRDEGLAEEAARRAEQQVDEWRRNDSLPFPNIPDEDRRDVWNTGDWPPEGAPLAPKG